MYIGVGGRVCELAASERDGEKAWVMGGNVGATEVVGQEGKYSLNAFYIYIYI